MSKTFFSTFTKTLLTLVAFVSLFSLFSGIETRAVEAPAYGTLDVVVVNAKAGLNLRAYDCQVADTVRYGAFIALDKRNDVIAMSPKFCTINGKKYEMVPVTTPEFYPGGAAVYAAKQYLSEYKPSSIVLQNSFGEKFSVAVNAINGLNLRDENCKKVKAVPNGTKLNMEIPLGATTLCERDNIVYNMWRVEYQGKYYLIASYYLKKV